MINWKFLLGLENGTLSPDYQLEKGVSQSFFNHVEYYMEKHYKFDEHPEDYTKQLRRAVNFANKSILLDKLGLGYHEDLEAKNPELFKSEFLRLASEDPNLLVKGGAVYMGDDLRKSFDAEEKNSNEYYEQLWKRTYDSLNAQVTPSE